MKHLIAIFFLLAVVQVQADEREDSLIQQRCLQSLADFTSYAKSIYTDAGKNSRGDAVGYFKAVSAGQSNEDGVRTNLDIAMVCAFLYNYIEFNGCSDFNLPHGINKDNLRQMAYYALRYAYSTHQAVRLMRCTDGKYWGTYQDELGQWHHQWESSLWVLSLAFTKKFIEDFDGLDKEEQELIAKLMASEADFQLSRPIPFGFQGDTKAEENGWESNVLAVAWANLTAHPHSPQWQEAMIRYGFNGYTVDADANDTTMIDGKQAREWYVGTNLYPDYTLQNHNYFHTSYQNVVMQEQAETILATYYLKEYRPPKLHQSLTWHWQEVWDEVLSQLALADGEMAMPNGNDWSMFLYDQLPAYAAMACIKRNPDALMLEMRCLDQLLKRQHTTPDGSYMLNPDIGPRRMGVTAHRVMMTWFLHRLFPTEDLRSEKFAVDHSNGMTDYLKMGAVIPSTWQDFRQRLSKTKVFPCQQIVRAISEDRFVCFSWSEGLKNATGIIVPNTVEDTKIIIPYKYKGTGNFLGCYNNAQTRLSGKPQFTTTDSTFQVRGRLMAAGGKVAQDFTFTADAHNAVVVEYQLQGNDTIFEERGGTVAVSVDPFTKTERTLYYEGGTFTSDGSQMRTFRSNWVNIDNRIGIIAIGENNEMAFGDRQLINSIQTARLYPAYSNSPRQASQVKRKYYYFTGQTAQETQQMFRSLQSSSIP